MFTVVRQVGLSPEHIPGRHPTFLQIGAARGGGRKPPIAFINNRAPKVKEAKASVRNNTFDRWCTHKF